MDYENLYQPGQTISRPYSKQYRDMTSETYKGVHQPHYLVVVGEGGHLDRLSSV